MIRKTIFKKHNMLKINHITSSRFVSNFIKRNCKKTIDLSDAAFIHTMEKVDIDIKNYFKTKYELDMDLMDLPDQDYYQLVETNHNHEAITKFVIKEYELMINNCI